MSLPFEFLDRHPIVIALAGSNDAGNPEESIKRVAMRVSQGCHDVPDEKLIARFKRTQENLKRAIERLPYVIGRRSQWFETSVAAHPHFG